MRAALVDRDTALDRAANMTEFPKDIYSEPENVDVNTLANLVR